MALEGGDGGVRQISATLETIAATGPTLQTRVHRKSEAPMKGISPETVDEAAVARQGDLGVMDSGWNTDKALIQQQMVNGVDNDNVWLLVRRFNKRIYHLKQAPVLPGDMDFNITTEGEFSANKFRAQVERLYMGVLYGLMVSVQHVARLRSWHEPRRTAAFCLVYFFSWYANYLMTTMLLTSTGLLISPKLRQCLFPPAPPALVDFQTGGLSKPPAGVLGSVDSVTGAPENNTGEALENEASNFVTAMVAIIVNAFTCDDPQHINDESRLDLLPEPNVLATKIATAKDKASGIDNPSYDKTKHPIEKAMWGQMKSLMHGITLTSDVWERCANLLAPSPSFPQASGQSRVIALMLLLVILSLFTTCHALYQFTTFVFGVGFFVGYAQDYVQVQIIYGVKSLIFKGVPTDAQLVISLLRLGEAHRTPLIPPPFVKGSPSHQPLALGDDVLSATTGDRPLGATQEELDEVAFGDQAVVDEAGGGDHESTVSGTQGKKKGHVLNAVKATAKAVTKVVIGVDRLRAKTGSESAKNRLGVTKISVQPSIAGPVEFKARFDGEQGFIYVTTDAGAPCLCFSATPSEAHVNADKLKLGWTMPIAEITELNKYSGYGTKAKLLAGWALGKEMLDGIEIKDGRNRTMLITALAQRDELFNRLCALSRQKWEVR